MTPHELPPDQDHAQAIADSLSEFEAYTLAGYEWAYREGVINDVGSVVARDGRILERQTERLWSVEAGHPRSHPLCTDLERAHTRLHDLGLMLQRSRCLTPLGKRVKAILWGPDGDAA